MSSARGALLRLGARMRLSATQRSHRASARGYGASAPRPATTAIDRSIRRARLARPRPRPRRPSLSRDETRWNE